MLQCSHKGEMGSDSFKVFCQRCGRSLVAPLHLGKSHEEVFTQPDRKRARSLVDAISQQYQPRQIP